MRNVHHGGVDTHAGSYGEEPSLFVAGSAAGDFSQGHGTRLCPKQPPCRGGRIAGHMEVLRQDVPRAKRDDAQRCLRSSEPLQSIKDCSIAAANHDAIDTALRSLFCIFARSPVWPCFLKLDLDTSLLKNMQDFLQIPRAT